MADSGFTGDDAGVCALTPNTKSTSATVHTTTGMQRSKDTVGNSGGWYHIHGAIDVGLRIIEKNMRVNCFEDHALIRATQEKGLVDADAPAGEGANRAFVGGRASGSDKINPYAILHSFGEMLADVAQFSCEVLERTLPQRLQGGVSFVILKCLLEPRRNEFIRLAITSRVNVNIPLTTPCSWKMRSAESSKSTASPSKAIRICAGLGFEAILFAVPFTHAAAKLCINACFALSSFADKKRSHAKASRYGYTAAPPVKPERVMSSWKCSTDFRIRMPEIASLRDKITTYTKAP